MRDCKLIADCEFRGLALERCFDVDRVYSMRQAVQGIKKKAGSKQAVQRLDGLYCSHVINKISVSKTGRQIY